MEVKLKLDTKNNPSFKDGQISVKLSKADEVRFKMLKAKYDKRLNEWARSLILKLIDQLESQDIAS